MHSLQVYNSTSLMLQNEVESENVAQTHCRPPRSWIIQTAVVAVLQAAGIWYSGGIIDLEPVRVVGHSTASELHQKQEKWKKKEF